MGGEGMRTFGAIKRVWSARSATLNVKRELYERIVVPTVIYGSESWGMKVEERGKLDVAEMKCLRSMCGVTRMDRVRNEVVRERVLGYESGGKPRWRNRLVCCVECGRSPDRIPLPQRLS